MSLGVTNISFEETCGVFINTVNHYFGHLTSEKSKTGVPFLKSQDKIELKDFTGLISISGTKKGYIFITGNSGLYSELIKTFIGVESANKEDLLDMAGELSNVIAGNLRETFGNNFIISVPIVFEGDQKSNLPLSKEITPYIIPIDWNSHKANLVIGIE